MFKTIRKKNKFEEVLDQIKELLVQKKLKIGQKLPNEIELSESMGISRSSLREALKILSILGIIEGKAGEGTTIKQARPENLKSIMSLVAISKGLDTEELFEVRITLETAAASLAAERAVQADLQEIKSILTKMDDLENKDSVTESDFLFHKAIVHASHNRMLILLVEVISDLLGEQIEMTRSAFASSAEILKRFQQEHWSIYQAITEQNSNRASLLMSEHLKNAHAERTIASKNEDESCL